MIKRLKKGLALLYISCLLLIIGLSIAVRQTDGSYFGYHFRTVLSESMTPTIPVGSLIVSKNVHINEVKAGDVVVANYAGEIVSHRVISVLGDGQSAQLQTKGDANDSPDQELLSAVELKEQVVGGVPKLGKVLLTLQTPLGGFSALCLLVFISLVNYFVKLWKQ